MFGRLQGRTIQTGLIVLAVPLCLPGVVRADGAAEFNRLDKEPGQHYALGQTRAEDEMTCRGWTQMHRTNTAVDGRPGICSEAEPYSRSPSHFLILGMCPIRSRFRFSLGTVKCAGDRKGHQLL